MYLSQVCNIVLNFTALWIACVAVDMKFPPGFKFGAATSAFQIEGAWNASDKGISVWDYLIHQNPSAILDGTTADVTCNSYHLWREDIRIAHELGLHFYRFSISWSRILPTGFANKVSKDGIKYYNELIDGLLRNGIEPAITLYHFDLPQSLQNLGGWANPLIVDWFADYARIIFSNYADRVKTWITINEPLMVCDYTYNSGLFVPMIGESWLGPFLCNKYILMAHAKAYRIYEENYKEKYHGKLSIAYNPLWLEPQTEDYKDLAELAREYGVGRYSDPIFSKEGGWPPAVEKLMIELSRKQGFPRSRLPLFTEEEKNFVKGTSDYFSLNQYASRIVRPAREGEEPGPWFMDGSKDLNVILEVDKNWKSSSFPYNVVHAKGMRSQIAWITKRYNNVSILVSENGLGTTYDDLHDTARVNFIRDYLEQILLAIHEDGANVVGYTVWSLMDNFELTLGHSVKFGLYNVDFTDPLRKRTPRASADYFKSIIKHHSLDVPLPSRGKRENAPNSAESVKSSICPLISLISLANILSNYL